MELHAYPQVVDHVTAPAVVVLPSHGDFDEAFQQGNDAWSFNLLVLVPRADDVTAQNMLDSLVSKTGPNSIRHALYVTADLGLGDVDTFVSALKGYGAEYNVVKVPHLGAILKVTVQAF
ncbi:hypothetical protein [Streptomyces sp. NPDC055085]